MRSDAVAVVRDAVASFNRHDWDSFAEFLHPRIRATDHQPPIGLAAQIDSRAEYIKACKGWVAEFDDARVEVDELVDAGDCVVCAARYCGTGRLSGARTEQRQFDFFRVEDGVIVEARVGFRTRAEALAAAGGPMPVERGDRDDQRGRREREDGRPRSCVDEEQAADDSAGE
jgi:ketosteroid isomerase-like protein